MILGLMDMKTTGFHLALEQLFHLYEALSKFKHIFSAYRLLPRGHYRVGSCSCVKQKFKTWEKKGKKDVTAGETLPVPTGMTSFRSTLLVTA